MGFSVCHASQIPAEACHCCGIPYPCEAEPKDNKLNKRRGTTGGQGNESRTSKKWGEVFPFSLPTFYPSNHGHRGLLIYLNSHHSRLSGHLSVS